MHGFSTADGFVEISESLAEMIKYVANEPSVGLFYIQQHTQNAVPNIINLKNNVANKSHETSLHTEDSEDSIAMVRSMKDCGFSIADDMIKDIKKSLSIMSAKQPKRGLISKPTFGFSGGTASSWGPVTWAHGSGTPQKGEGSNASNSGIFSNVLKSAREKAGNLKWPQLDAKDSSPSNPTPPLSVASTETDDLPLSSQVPDEVPGEEEEEEKEGTVEVSADVGLLHHNILSLSEDFDGFKADKEAKLEEWLKGTEDNPVDVRGN